MYSLQPISQEGKYEKQPKGSAHTLLVLIGNCDVIQLTLIWILPQAIHLQLLFSLGLAQSIFWWRFLLFPTSLPVSQGGFYKTLPWTLRLQGSLTRLKMFNFRSKKRLFYCCAEFSLGFNDKPQHWEIY